MALGSVLSKVLERILVDRLKIYRVTTDNQFGIKNKRHSSVYVCTEGSSTKSTVFTCFLYASIALEGINHGKLFATLPECAVSPYVKPFAPLVLT